MHTHERGRAPAEKDETRLTVPGSLPGLSRNKTQAPILAQAAGGAKRCDTLELAPQGDVLAYVARCTREMELAYDQSQDACRSPAAREQLRAQAIEWMNRRDAVMRSLPSELQAARHAAFEARVVLRDAELVRGALAAEGITW